MQDKIKQYFELVNMVRTVIRNPNGDAIKQRLAETKRKIAKAASELVRPDVDMEVLLARLNSLKHEREQLVATMEKMGITSHGETKKRVAELRTEILSESHREDWPELVEFFRKNPIALTSLIHQTNYDAADAVYSLRKLPFRGRAGGGQVSKFTYRVILESGEERKFSAIRKIILELDQYGTQFSSLDLTYATLKRYLKKGLSINGVPVKEIIRE
ncbi:MAG: hypothetical protein Kow00107_07240 [Planctomycetota bacterium]